MLLLRAFSLLSFSCEALYMSTSAAWRQAALKSASLALGDCGCSRAYFSYSSDSFSGHLVSPFHEPHSLLSIRSNDARSAHLVWGNFLMTSLSVWSSMPSRMFGSISRDDGRRRTSPFSRCQRMSAARHSASPASGELGKYSYSR